MEGFDRKDATWKYMSSNIGRGGGRGLGFRFRV